ncbi:MAG: adenosine deaminase [Gemmatimonadota bacterium]
MNDAAEPLSREWLRAMPKAELHVHLDGSLRPATMLELAGERGVPMPASQASELSEYMLVSDAASLEEYLERFSVTLSVMQDAEALERIAYECVTDHAAEGVTYAEVRFCPLLNCARGMTPDGVLDAALRGLRRAEEDAKETRTPIRARLIVCALRSHAPSETLAMAELAVAYQRRGVVAFDLAGPEDGFPVRDHREAFDHAHRAELPITIHAGEGFGAPSIHEALDIGHARRIGHGTRLYEDRILLDRVRDERILLEICLTSNVQTRVVDRMEQHPARRYQMAGVPITLSTDNRLMSGVDLTDEFAHAVDAFSLVQADVLQIARAGFEHAFVEDIERADMLDAFDAWAEASP